MDSYVIRVYRQQKAEGSGKRLHDAVMLNGIVVHPESGEQVSFHDIDSLWELLVKDTNIDTDTEEE